MLRFKKLNIDDLGKIYEDASLKPILNISAEGDGFGVLIEKDGELRGGLTGYIDKKRAVIENIRVLDHEDHDALKDGLIRSTIHILDREGIEMLYSKCMDEVHKRIGFRSREDGEGSTYGGVLSIPSFFNSKCSGCSKDCIFPEQKKI